MRAFVTGGGGFVGGELVRQYWASDAKARSELGYAPRDLDSGLHTLLAMPAGGGRE